MGRSNETKGHSWFYVSNTADKKYGTGYYFPKDMLNSVRYRFAKRSSNGTDGKFFEFWLDLGTNKSYDYVIFPEVETHAPVNAYFANPDNVIIANTSSVQAAYQKTDGVLAANFWTEAGGTVKSNYHSTLTVFQKASVLMQAKDGILSISVSDPENIQMHLQNAASQIIESKIQPLAPVQVTMQLPDDISASLPVYAGHINADNSIDWQKARVENNTMSFVVTSLSPFVIANIAENANDSQDSNQNSDDDDDDYGSGADRGKASGSVGTWMQNSTGWWYERADGSWPADTWEKINGIWYLFDKKGYMMTGWQKRGFYWYYMDSSGAMLEQAWTQSEGKWYWLGQDGIMSASAWVLYKNQWYYLKQNGEMAVSERVDQDRYQVDKNGVWTGQ